MILNPITSWQIDGEMVNLQIQDPWLKMYYLPLEAS